MLNKFPVVDQVREGILWNGGWASATVYYFAHHPFPLGLKGDSLHGPLCLQHVLVVTSQFVPQAGPMTEEDLGALWQL